MAVIRALDSNLFQPSTFLKCFIQYHGYARNCDNFKRFLMYFSHQLCELAINIFFFFFSNKGAAHKSKVPGPGVHTRCEKGSRAAVSIVGIWQVVLRPKESKNKSVCGGGLGCNLQAPQHGRTEEWMVGSAERLARIWWC